MKILTAELERRCRQPEDLPRGRIPEVAFAGRSNVGKSCLINCLVHRRGLAPVSSTPGKTRSIDFFLVNGVFRLVDLPGYGYARVPEPVQRKWKDLIEGYLRNRPNLACVVWILDLRRDLSELDRLLLGWMERYGVTCLPVLTKADKVSRGERSFRQRRLQQDLGEVLEPVVFSARTGEGKAVLWKRLLAAISDFPPS